LKLLHQVIVIKINHMRGMTIYLLNGINQLDVEISEVCINF